MRIFMTAALAALMAAFAAPAMAQSLPCVWGLDATGHKQCMPPQAGVQGPAGPAGQVGPAGAAGAPGIAGTPGAAGPAGASGIGVSSAAINGSGHLILTLSDGTQVDAGVAVGAAGAAGAAGATGATGAAGPQGPAGQNAGQQGLFTPSSSSAACSQGQSGFDASYVYFCVAGNSWVRLGLPQSWQ